MAKYLTQSGGGIAEAATPTTSAGAGDAGKIPGLDNTGRLDTSFMPTGIGADTQAIAASEALAAGDFVNVHSLGGAKVRKADASVAGKRAHGFVLSSVGSGATATVYFEGTNGQVTGQTPGDVYLSAATPGAATTTPPTGSGQVVQIVGMATSATSINVNVGQPITLA